jgi:hypothetical protein
MSAERTAKAIVAGTWGCAGIVMAGSATNAFLAYGALGDNRALGLATGLAVDIGLCVALIGDRRLYAHGLSSNWGRALRITTAVMSLILNTCIALRDGQALSALMHAFLPILLVVLTEYGQDVLLKFTALRRDAEAGAGLAVSHQPAEPALPIVAPVVVATPEPVAVRQEPVVVAPPEPPKPAPVAARQKPAKPAATAEERRNWVRQELAAGRTPTGAELDKRFGLPRNGARIVKEVVAESRPALRAVVAGKG